MRSVTVDDEVSYHAPDDVVRAIEQLNVNKHDLRRLRRNAGMYAGSLPCASADDLLTDALGSAFLAASGKGGRRWKVGIPFMHYLHLTIRGIASDSRRSKRRIMLRDIFDSDDHLQEIEPQLHVPSIEQQCVAAPDASIEALTEQFERDPQIRSIIEAINEGKRPSAIQQLFGMTPVQYASALRRFRRMLNKLYPDSGRLPGRQHAA